MKFLEVSTVLCLYHLVLFFYSVQCDLRYPSPLKTIIYQPTPGKYAFEVTWNRVKNWDETNPIIGYRYVLWEMQKVKPEKLSDGEETFVDDDDNPFTSKFTAGLPKIYEVAADNRKVVVEDLKPGVWYEDSALAFTKKGEGPLSPPTGKKIGKK